MKIDWSNIETVLLDMDGTLLDLHFDNYFWQYHLPKIYADKHGLNESQSNKILQPLFTRHAGTLDWYCIEFWSEQLDLDVMQLKHEVAHKIQFRTEAQSFMRLCRQQVNDLRLITNAHRQVLNLKIKHLSFEHYFDNMICSHELQSPKESEQFWHALAKHKMFDPATTLFIDDSEPVLDMAAEYGIEHIYSITKPDSQDERDVASKYAMIDSFASIY